MVRKQGEEAAGKRSEMPRDAEGPMWMEDKSRKNKKKISGEDSVGSESWMLPEAEGSGKRSEMQRATEEPTGTLRKPKKKKKKKPGKGKGHAQDPIGSHQIGDKCYQGVTLQHATKLFRDQIKKKNRNKGDSKMPPQHPDQAGKAAQQSQVTSQASMTETVKKEAVNVLDSCESGKRSEMQATTPLPAYYSRLPPEYHQKQLKHNQEGAAEEIDALLASHKKRTENKRSQLQKKKKNKRSQNSLGELPDEAENELGRKRWMSGIPPMSEEARIDLVKRTEMGRISRDRLRDAEIHRALLDIQDKLTSKETTKIDKDTVRLLKDVSNYKLDVLDDDDRKGEMDKLAIADQTCLNATDHSGNPPLLGAKKTVAEEMAQELETFASHRRRWEDKWSKTCGTFTQATLLSSMQFTHYTPGRTFNTECSTGKTLQIISIQLTQLADGLEFPLSVYGLVAVRDIVDRNRNVLFFRNRYKAQELTQNDNFLHLNGPSRAIVFTGKVWIEIELRVKGGAYSQNEVLISRARRYNGRSPGVSTICFKNALCTLEVCLQPVENAVQATILGVQAAEDDGSWPFQYGGLVACIPQSGTRRVTDGIIREIDPSSAQIVLIESKDDAMPKGHNAHALLRRQVVSVDLEGRLDVVIKAYSKSGAIVANTSVSFDPKVCNTTQTKFTLGDAIGAVTVAWSRVAGSKTGASVELNYEGLTLQQMRKLFRDQEEKKIKGNSWINASSPLPPEYREKLMKHIQNRTTMDAFRDRLLDVEIHKALLDIQDKLTSKETTKIDEDTLRLLKDVSNYKFDVFDDDHQKGEMDKLAIAHQTGLNTSDHSGNSPLLMAKKSVAKLMAQELETFASHRRRWEHKWSETCGIFTTATLLSSMLFAHYTPGRRTNNECSMMETLQIISIQLTQISDGLEFPLSVYGVVAVRDMVDRNRNVLFFRNSDQAQELKQNDNFLDLIGPSRAIVMMEHVWIEIELMVKGGAYSENEVLICCARRYNGGNPGMSTICFKNALCTLELCLQPVEEAVQATILGVQVATDDGSWPFEYGGLVACIPQSGTLRVIENRIIHEIINPSSTQIVLIESKDGAIPKGENGHVLLRRQVVSVNCDGRLDVVIKAYSKSGAIVAEACVCFDSKLCNISRKKFVLGDAEGAVAVAWSRVVDSKMGASI